MNGKALVFKPGYSEPEVTEFIGKVPGLDWLQGAVGGYIESIPHFKWFEDGGQWVPCIAYGDEEAKLKEGGLLNTHATLLWDWALRHEGFTNGLLDANGNPLDVLLGPVVVLIGDKHWMAKQ